VTTIRGTEPFKGFQIFLITLKTTICVCLIILIKFSLYFNPYVPLASGLNNCAFWPRSAFMCFWRFGIYCVVSYQEQFLHTVKHNFYYYGNLFYILREKSNKMQQCIKILLFLILNEAQHVGRCQVAYPTWQSPTTARPTTFHVCKTRGCLYSFRLLTMGGVSPETCWASFKIRNKKILIHCCILLDFSVRIVLWCTDSQTSTLLHSLLNIDLWISRPVILPDILLCTLFCNCW